MVTREELDKAFDSRFPAEIRMKLQAARVAVAGLGGLGSNTAVLLARAGVGHLKLIDFDMVEISNLNRQVYRLQDLGKLKAEALCSIIREIDPYIELTAVSIKVTPENISELFSGYPIVCEAFDRPDQKAMLVSGLLSKDKDTIVVSGNGMAGFSDTNMIRTEKVMSRLYVCGDGTSEAGENMGLLAPRVAVCAGHQANKIIQLITGQC